MRNGLLGSLLVLLLAAGPAAAQAPAAPSFVPGLDAPWQPPRTDGDDRPNIAPAGYRFYGGTEYLLWWTETDHRVSGAGPLAAAATGFEPLTRQGQRGVLGMWLDRQQRCAVEIGGFWLADAGARAAQGSGDVVADARYHNRFTGAEANLRAEVYRGDYAHFDLLTGFRYLRFDDFLRVVEHDFAADTSTFDQSGTRNRYYGGQLGAETELHRGDWFVDLWGKLALGASCEVMNFSGTLLPAGRQSHQDFAVVPEFGVNLGYHLTQHIRVTAGYTFLYLSDAARPAEQLDHLLSSPRPVHAGDVWMQGINLGFEFRF